MSLDGFIAHLDDSVGHLFDWYDNGEVDDRVTHLIYRVRTGSRESGMMAS
jgi:hypothetical protein